MTDPLLKNSITPRGAKEGAAPSSVERRLIAALRPFAALAETFPRDVMWVESQGVRITSRSVAHAHDVLTELAALRVPCSQCGAPEGEHWDTGCEDQA